MRQAGEPSVEEILESIKKVIARDNRAEAEQVRRRREEDGIVTTRSYTGDEAPEDRAPAFPPAFPGPNADDEPAPVLELTDAEMAPMTDDDDDAEGYDPAHQTIEAYPSAASDADEPLVAETARASMAESLSALAMLAEPGARPQIVRSGETSLEGLTRDLLRPMLAEWLERNLPPMVEKLVTAEISRIAGKRG
ncbi:MAG TPA: DUF2497 domain-containing protein [Novosphingobium sp.]|nr:DUF2497 domain-containing protein [Novosphingobium sp.]